MSTRKGDWMQTYSGVRFWPQDPAPGDFYIGDIAHGLSCVCRFGGHCTQFYSVAQHCLLVVAILRQWGCPIGEQYQGLMHDAPEAYTGDNVRPRKYGMPDLLAEEKRIWGALARRFELPIELSPVVKQADDVALMTERRDLLRPSSHRWCEYLERIKPWPNLIVPMSPERAEVAFLNAYEELARQLEVRP